VLAVHVRPFIYNGFHMVPWHSLNPKSGASADSATRATHKIKPLASPLPFNRPLHPAHVSRPFGRANVAGRTPAGRPPAFAGASRNTSPRLNRGARGGESRTYLNKLGGKPLWESQNIGKKFRPGWEATVWATVQLWLDHRPAERATGARKDEAKHCALQRRCR